MGGTISCTPCNTIKNSSVPDFIFHNSSAPCSNAKLPGAHFILLFCFFVRFGGCFGLCIRCLFQGFLLRKMLDNFIFRQLQMALVDGPCLVRIVGQQAVHNIAVLFHRFIKALGTCQRINTELLVQRMDPCIHGFQKAVAAQFNQQPVQLRIHIRVGTQVLLGVQPLHLVQAVDQLLHIRRGQVVLQLADGVIFQQNAQVKNFLNVPRGKLFYKHTLVGDLHHQPVRSQLAQCFPDGAAAHAEGVAFIRKWSQCPSITGDIVVTSNGGYPLDQNLYQSPKAVATAEACAGEDGVIIMCCSCADGMGGTHFEKLITMGTVDEIDGYLSKIPPKETIPEQWCPQIYARILKKHPVILVTTYLKPEEVRKANMIPASTPDEALEIAYQMKGRDASVVVIPDGVSVLAVKE